MFYSSANVPEKSGATFANNDVSLSSALPPLDAAIAGVPPGATAGADMTTR